MRTVIDTARGRLGAPFVGRTLMCSADPAELSRFMGRQSVNHDVEILSSSLSGLVTGHQVGEVNLAYVSYGSPAHITAQPTDDRVCWTIPLGPMQVGLGRSQLHLQQGFALDHEGSTTMRPHPFSGAVVLTVPRERLVRHFRLLRGRPDAPAPRLEVGPSRTPHGLIDLGWRQAAQILALTPTNRGLVSVMEENLLTAMLVELPGDAARLLALDDRPVVGAEAHTRRAVDWVRDRLAEPIQLSQWAAAAGVSVRHLQKSFREVHGCTPMDYLKEARLQQAHAQLKRPREGDTVTSIATRAGFHHMGRFAAAYRHRFGVPPSTTLAGPPGPRPSSPSVQ